MHQLYRDDIGLVYSSVQGFELLAAHVPVDFLLSLWLGRLRPDHLPAIHVFWLKIRWHCLDNHLLLRCPRQQVDHGRRYSKV